MSCCEEIEGAQERDAAVIRWIRCNDVKVREMEQESRIESPAVGERGDSAATSVEEVEHKM